MDDLSLFNFFKTKLVDVRFEFRGNLQESLKDLFARTVSSTSANTDEIGPIVFKPSKDRRIRGLEYEMLCAGRTLSDAIVKVENEFPVMIVAIPTEAGGYEITLEYYERSFEYV